MSKEEQIASLQSELAQLRNSREEYVVLMRDALEAAESHCGAVHGGYGTEREIAETHKRFSELCMKYYKHSEDDTVLSFIDMRDYNVELKARAEKAESELEAWRQWRTGLLDCWANDHRATMTAMLEGGPANSEGLGGE